MMRASSNHRGPCWIVRSKSGQKPWTYLSQSKLFDGYAARIHPDFKTPNAARDDAWRHGYQVKHDLPCPPEPTDDMRRQRAAGRTFRVDSDNLVL